jgi:hypothetical protein
VRFAVDAYVNFARTRPWVEAVASSLTELFAPDLMAERLAAFERWYPWIDPDGLAYFRARLEQAPRDCEHALEVVTAHCLSAESQARAVDALSFKCDVLWSLMDAIDRPTRSDRHGADHHPVRRRSVHFGPTAAGAPCPADLLARPAAAHPATPGDGGGSERQRRGHPPAVRRAAHRGRHRGRAGSRYQTVPDDEVRRFLSRARRRGAAWS